MNLVNAIPSLVASVREIVRGYNDRSMIREVVSAAEALDADEGSDMADLVSYLRRFSPRMPPELKDRFLRTCLEVWKVRRQRLDAIDRRLQRDGDDD